VTYLWGRDWDLETLIQNCEKSGMTGLELRTQHAHGVEPSLTREQRSEVRRRFEDSSITCVGYGSNQEYHSPDPAILERNIEGTFELIRLCRDIGASGVKVKPNNLPEGIPPERTIEQIGQALNRVGRYASDYGQVIRVEVHGRRTQEIPVMKAIFDHVEESSVGICWNCNDADLRPPGLEQNFKSLRPRFGDTLHVRELNDSSYPYQELMRLLVRSHYTGWVLLEARSDPADRLVALREQVQVFENMVQTAKTSL
jgi:sugar phosphate isomerase/epimerase